MIPPTITDLTDTIPFYTRTGGRLNLLNIRPEDIRLDEISNALSNQGRYNGQTSRFYSVAEHCVHLCKYAEAKGMSLNHQRALLLHDASEAFMGDLVYHLKQQFPYFKEIEDNIMKVIFDKYGVDYDSIVDDIHRLDRAICIDEMTSLMYWVDPALSNLTPLGININNFGDVCSPEWARHLFMVEATRLKLTNKEIL